MATLAELIEKFADDEADKIALAILRHLDALGAEVRAVSVTEAAKLVSLDRSNVYRLIKAGRFPHLRIDGRIIVPLRALDEWLEKEMA